MRFRYSFVVALLLLGWLLSGTAVTAQPPAPETPFQVTPQADGVTMTWHGAVGMTRSLTPAVPDWPAVEIGGVVVPAQLVALRVPGEGEIKPQIVSIESQPWSGVVPGVEVPIPRTAEGNERPDLAVIPAQNLPVSPVTVLREGQLRGTRIVVLAISPLFVQDGVTRAATRLQVSVPGVTLFDSTVAPLLAGSGPFLATTPGPTNSAAFTASLKVRVAQAGVQRITGADLARAGVDIATLDPARLRLRLSGNEVPLEQHGSGAGLEMRFYAPAPGDRWNAADTYWLTIEAEQGLRMATRSVASGSAPLRTTAVERGIWRNNSRYDSTMPGPDGDHWFAADMKTGPDQPTATITVTPAVTLPPAGGPVTLTVNGAAYTRGEHNLSVRMGSSEQRTSWSGKGNWSQQFVMSENAPIATLNLLPGPAPDGFQPDSVGWERPVRLDFSGRGAAFTGVAGVWRYRLDNLPPGSALYDVTDPRAPVALTGLGSTFEDGPSSYSYVLAGPGTLHTPEVTAHTPVNLSPLNVQALYIAPPAFEAALAPLVARRQAQGYSAGVVDVQQIYDAWSFGQVSPDAIRNFLRYAAATWNTPPLAVTLVGDGTSDPLNYTGRNNTNFIPPYLANVDLWLGETACENCYAQLNGDSPLADDLPDLLLGRLPVKSVDELQKLVAKLIAYETTPVGGPWRSRVLFLTDDADSAGDFAAFADVGVAQQPVGVLTQRVYYDPAATPATPWREADPLKARSRAMAAISSGAGVVTYIGHSSQWQWATTAPPLQPGQPNDKQFLLGLYDTDELTNGPRLPIVLGMTCLTSAFQTPAFSGTTIDERFLLKPDGGAAAVWGSAGLGVTHGHDALQRGFFRTLWSAPRLTASVGSLTMGGYIELFTNGGCCRDALRTFLLQGDPLTTARVFAGSNIYLPLVRR